MNLNTHLLSIDDIEEIRPRIATLSAREFEVLGLLTAGMTNYSIGVSLGIAERTAREHVARIMLKLRVGSRVEIAVIATKWDVFQLMTRGQLGGPQEPSDTRAGTTEDHPYMKLSG